MVEPEEVGLVPLRCSISPLLVGTLHSSVGALAERPSLERQELQVRQESPLVFYRDLVEAEVAEGPLLE